MMPLEMLRARAGRIGRWLIAVFALFQVQVAVAGCQLPEPMPATAFAGQGTILLVHCVGTPAGNPSTCLGHCLQAYQASDPGNHAAVIPAPAVVSSSAVPPFDTPPTLPVSYALADNFPPPRVLFCCLRN